jgi:hypothetical protein
MSTQSERDRLRKENSTLTNQTETLKTRQTSTTKNESNNSGISVSMILKDLEDGKNLIERKNAEIITLRNEVKMQDDKLRIQESKMSRLS